MTSTFQPTPEVLEVLAEVERAPRSKLLRPPLQLGPGNLGIETWTGGEPFLSSAERKLVRAFREELETYVFYIGQAKMLESQWSKDSMINHAVSSKEARSHIGRMKRPSIDAASRRLWGNGSGGFAHENIRDQWQGPNRYFRIAYSLIRRVSTRTMCGLACTNSGQPAMAEREFRSVLHSNAPPLHRSIAGLNLGLLYWESQRFRDASRAYLWAFSIDGDRTSALYWAVGSAFFSGDTKTLATAESFARGLGLQTPSPILTRAQQIMNARSSGFSKDAFKSKVKKAMNGSVSEALLQGIL